MICFVLSSLQEYQELASASQPRVRGMQASEEGVAVGVGAGLVLFVAFAGAIETLTVNPLGGMLARSVTVPLLEAFLPPHTNSVSYASLVFATTVVPGGTLTLM